MTNDLDMQKETVKEKYPKPPTFSSMEELVSMLEKASEDIANGNYLTEEEMDRKLDLLMKQNV